MRGFAIGLGLGVSLLGCSVLTPRGEQVPLLTADEVGGPSFVNVVIDVIADPETGTPIIEFNGATMHMELRWPTGYTAWRVGSETEVLDPAGNRVMVTGQRYRFFPGPDYGSEPQPGVWIPGPYVVIAYVQPCLPWSCVLGWHQQDNY